MGVLHLKLTAKNAKAVAQLLASDTARRVMDAISEESKTESEVAKKLGMPLSTVHYNMQKLVEAGLVVSDEYTYSKKGKQVRHYKLASEHVVITTNPLATLPTALTGLGLSVAVAAGIFFFTHTPSSPMTARTESDAMVMMAESAPTVVAEPLVWPWILFGAVVMLAGILLATLIQRYRA